MFCRAQNLFPNLQKCETRDSIGLFALNLGILIQYNSPYGSFLPVVCYTTLLQYCLMKYTFADLLDNTRSNPLKFTFSYLLYQLICENFKVHYYLKCKIISERSPRECVFSFFRSVHFFLEIWH